jgi:hypothetical protein
MNGGEGGELRRIIEAGNFLVHGGSKNGAKDCNSAKERVDKEVYSKESALGLAGPGAHPFFHLLSPSCITYFGQLLGFQKVHRYQEAKLLWLPLIPDVLTVCIVR